MDRVEQMQENARQRRELSLAKMERDPPADYLMTDDLTRYIPAEFLNDTDLIAPKPRRRAKDAQKREKAGADFFLTAVDAVEEDAAAAAGTVALPPDGAVAVPAAGAAPQPPKQPARKRRPSRHRAAWMPKTPADLPTEEDLTQLKQRRQQQERDELREYLTSMGTSDGGPCRHSLRKPLKPCPKIHNRTEHHGKEYKWNKQERHTLVTVRGVGGPMALTAPPQPKGRL